MKSSLIYAVVLTLSSVAIISPSYASGRMHNDKVPHIYGNTEFSTTRWGTSRHTIRLHVPKDSKAITELIIKVPDNVTVSNDIRNIDVMNENGQKINTNISVNGKNIVLAFTEPVPPNTKLNVDINNVQRQNLGNGYIYKFAVKEDGIDAEIPIGDAWFRTY